MPGASRPPATEKSVVERSLRRQCRTGFVSVHVTTNSARQDRDGHDALEGAIDLEAHAGPWMKASERGANLRDAPFCRTRSSPLEPPLACWEADAPKESSRDLSYRVPRHLQGRCRELELLALALSCRGIWGTEDLPENQARQKPCGRATASERMNVLLLRGRDVHEPRATGRQGSCSSREVQFRETGVCRCLLLQEVFEEHSEATGAPESDTRPEQAARSSLPQKCPS